MLAAGQITALAQPLRFFVSMLSSDDAVQCGSWCCEPPILCNSR